MPTGSSYYLKFKKKGNSRGRKKADAWVDLELPRNEKCSWWRLDGYDTCGDDQGEAATAEQEPEVAGEPVAGAMELSEGSGDSDDY